MNYMVISWEQYCIKEYREAQPQKTKTYASGMDDGEKSAK